MEQKGFLAVDVFDFANFALIPSRNDFDCGLIINFLFILVDRKVVSILKNCQDFEWRYRLESVADTQCQDRMDSTDQHNADSLTVIYEIELFDLNCRCLCNIFTSESPS